MSQPQYCTEAKVRQIVQQEVSRHVLHYERTVGNPRHVANQYLLKSIKGGITVLKWLGSISVALLTLYIAWRHH